MTWGLLDDKLHSHPKVVEAGNEAVGAWIRLVSYCCDHRGTKGRIPRAYALSVTSAKTLGRLVTVALLDADGDAWRIHDFDDWSGSKQGPTETPASLSLKRSEAGKRGAAKRWHGDDPATVLPEAKDGKLPLAKHSSDPIRSDPQRSKTSPVVASRSDLAESASTGSTASAVREPEQSETRLATVAPIAARLAKTSGDL